MSEEILYRRHRTLIRRQRLASGESTPWHRDPYHRVTRVLSGNALAIEYRDGRPSDRVSVCPGQVDWDEPTNSVHRGVNVGREPYEEIALFLLDQDDADLQPRLSENEDDGAPPSSVNTLGNTGQEIIGVSSVVRDATGRILLIKTAKAGWELPGGRVERGEELICALVREVREEACCQIDVGRLTGITVRTESPRLTVLTFLCRHVEGEPQPGDDSIDARWFAADTAVTLVTHPVELVRLTDALADGEAVVYRTYRRVPGHNQRDDTFEMLGHYRW
jgi:8-oxo-dGTP diphosphatase